MQSLLNPYQCHFSPPWLGLCHNTLKPAGTPRLHSNADIMRCIVMQGPSSARSGSLHNSIHLPQTEINPLVICGFFTSEPSIHLPQTEINPLVICGFFASEPSIHLPQMEINPLVICGFFASEPSC